MAPVDRRVRLWAWLVKQNSIGAKTEAEIIAMQSRATPANPIFNRIFGTVLPGTEVRDRAIDGPAGDIPARAEICTEQAAALGARAEGAPGGRA